MQARDHTNDEIPPEYLLWDRIRITESGCWEFTGSRIAHPVFCYGRIKFNKVTFKAHRLALFYTLGYWPKFACHHCDNPPCVNPDHLYDGDATTNARDVAVRQRNRRSNSETFTCGHPKSEENTLYESGSSKYSESQKRCKQCRYESTAKAYRRKMGYDEDAVLPHGGWGVGRPYPTHCIHGHEYSAENTRYDGKGRYCLECKRETGRRARERNKSKEK